MCHLAATDWCLLVNFKLATAKKREGLPPPRRHLITCTTDRQLSSSARAHESQTYVFPTEHGNSVGHYELTEARVHRFDAQCPMPIFNPLTSQRNEHSNSTDDRPRPSRRGKPLKNLRTFWRIHESWRE
jgi:hypothetical protein